MSKSKEQLQILILSAIVLCGALFAGVYFWLLPMLEESKITKAEVKELELKMNTARQYIQKTSEFKLKHQDSVGRLKYYDRYIPKPVLGNYRIEMEKDLTSCAEGLPVTFESFTDAGISEIGQKSLFQIYKVRVNCKTGTEELIRLLEKVSVMYPLVSVTEIAISPIDGTPMQHKISFVVGWLIWKDPFNIPESITKPLTAPAHFGQ
ncbi:MAG: hypothetical protein GX811_05625 [Lentisphaerae bacterium]|nr:hypothetical protein [Lentisphaerota bacterium]